MITCRNTYIFINHELEKFLQIIFNLRHAQKPLEVTGRLGLLFPLPAAPWRLTTSSLKIAVLDGHASIFLAYNDTIILMMIH